MRNSRRTRRENKELVLLPPLRVPCGRGAEGVPAAIGQLVRPRRRPSSVQAPPRTSSRSGARLELRRALWGCRRPAAALGLLSAGVAKEEQAAGSRRRLGPRVGSPPSLPRQSRALFFCCGSAPRHGLTQRGRNMPPQNLEVYRTLSTTRGAAAPHSLTHRSSGACVPGALIAQGDSSYWLHELSYSSLESNDSGYTQQPWLPDELCGHCMLCQQRFHLWRWTHHCRDCGG